MHPELPRVITPSTASHYGVSRSRLRTEVRRGRWQTLAPGLVLTRRGEPDRWDWADAGLASAGPSAALSGWDACRLAGVGDRNAPPTPVLVLTGLRRSRRIGDVLIRRTDRPYATSLTSVHAELSLAPVVALPRAVSDAALTMTRLDSVRALVASAVRNGRRLTSDLAAELDSGPKQGSGLLRQALGEVAVGARSAAEARALTVLTRAPVPSFEVNVPVLDVFGRVRWILDVFWRELRAALEIDSAEYHLAPREWKATMARHNELSARGLMVTHHPPSRIIREPRQWTAEVERWLRGRARELGVAYRPGGPVPTQPYLG